ncbi:germination lipoprotein GerS-related protein [Clostridium sp. KNHs214]|uniref:germination lipoprotein GerS-related protein n=1 Tax=Clostridium sp. KNHs214 TaxID=1540257 RepID=UPI0005521AB8|nr:germination lipoprotein GerS-related protein [Clostridium sp. KNHs214]
MKSTNIKNTNKIITLILFMVLLLSLTACGNKKTEKENEIIDIIKAIDKYSTNIEITTINSRQKIQLKGKQTYVKGEVAKLEINGVRQMVYEGEKVRIKDIENKKKYSIDESFDSLYKLSFIDEYIKLIYNNEKIKYKYKKLDGNEYLVVIMDLPYNNRNLSKVNLYLDCKDKKPYKVVIYNKKDEEKVNILYKKFCTH